MSSKLGENRRVDKQSQTISGNVQQGPVVVIRQAVNLLQTIAAQGSRCVGRSYRGEANC